MTAARDELDQATAGHGVAASGRAEPAEAAPRLRVSREGEVTRVSLDEAGEPAAVARFMRAIGTSDVDFATGLIQQMTNVAAIAGKAEEETLNFVTAMVKGVKPRDEIEAMLAVEMAAVHLATVTFARRLVHVETLPQQDSAERALNKLARTFVSQVEALKRYRSGGEQKVTVEHVTVNQGGQAIVGNVQAPARPAEPPPLITDRSGAGFTLAGAGVVEAVASGCRR